MVRKGWQCSLPHFKEGSEKKNEPNTPKAVGKYQRLVNGYLSPVFLRFCHFSKSTLEVNCVLAIDVQVQFYTQTLQLSKLIPNRSELPNRNSFTRKGLFHAGEMGYRFPGFTEYSAPEIFNWPCNLVLFCWGKQERSIHYSSPVKLSALPRGWLCDHVTAKGPASEISYKQPHSPLSTYTFLGCKGQETI